MTVRSSYFMSQPKLRELFSEHENLIFIANHSTPLSWLPTICLLGTEAVRNGGESRTPIGVMDKFFFQVPFLKTMSQFLTQSSVMWSFEEIKDRLISSSYMDLMLFPEGSNCFFGEPSEIQEFRSPRFVELSIMTGTPIVLVVHQGSESWAQALDIGESLLPFSQFIPSYVQKKINETGVFTLPLVPGSIEAFKMSCVLYKSPLKPEDLSQNIDERKSQIKEEAEKVRQLMIKQLHLLSQTQPSI